MVTAGQTQKQFGDRDTGGGQIPDDDHAEFESQSLEIRTSCDLDGDGYIGRTDSNRNCDIQEREHIAGQRNFGRRCGQDHEINLAHRYALDYGNLQRRHGEQEKHVAYAEPSRQSGHYYDDGHFYSKPVRRWTERNLQGNGQVSDRHTRSNERSNERNTGLIYAREKPATVVQV
jgi:hypothetical protein